MLSHSLICWLPESTLKVHKYNYRINTTDKNIIGITNLNNIRVSFNRCLCLLIYNSIKIYYIDDRISSVVVVASWTVQRVRVACTAAAPTPKITRETRRKQSRPRLRPHARAKMTEKYARHCPAHQLTRPGTRTWKVPLTTDSIRTANKYT